MERKEISRLAPIKNGMGTITGWIRLYWAESLKTWVSIPEREIDLI